MLRFRILLQNNVLFLGLLLLSLILAGVHIYVVKPESKYSITTPYIEGVLLNLVKNEDKYTLTIKGKETVRATYITEEALELELGQTIILEGSLSEPYNNTIPNTFNYKKYLNNHRIYYVMKVTGLKQKAGNPSLRFQVKNILLRRIEQFTYTKEYLKTFILGDKVDLEAHIYSTFQNNGVAHLFAISGMHINLLAGFMLLWLKKLKSKAQFNVFLVLTFLVFYAMLTNYSASIERSIIFFILVSVNRLYNFNVSTKNLLFLTCSILLLKEPLIIFDIGFQYSVIVTYGLIISRRYYKKGYFYNLLVTSVIAFLFSLPITLMNNYEINILTIFNNLIFGPLITFIIYPLSLIVLIVKYLEPLLLLFLNLMEHLSILLNKITLFKVIIPKVPNFLYLGYYLLLITGIYSNNKKYLLMGLILILSFKFKYEFDGKTYVYFLDVGQGDSTLIYNRNEVVLIDTGGLNNYQVSNNTMVFLKSLGISQLDLLLITHGDFDHAGDALNIIEKFKVKKVMLNNNEVNKLEQDIIKNFPNIVNEYKSSLSLTFYNEDRGKDENASSIISLLKINHHQLLFMGDATKAEEQLLLNISGLKADIIKLGHHGSKTSSAPNFLEQIGAREAIISSGRNNLFKHPSKETVTTLESLNIKYYDTQLNGTIKYIFGRNNYTIMTFPP